MSSIYVKVTAKKNWHFEDFDFLSLKNLSLGQFLGSSKWRRYHWILKLLVATENSEAWEQNTVLLFHYFNFERNYDILKSKSPFILLNKNINFNTNETESKMENPTHSIRETNRLLQLIQELQLKSKTVMSWSSRIKKEGIYCLFCPKEIFLTFTFYVSV